MYCTYFISKFCAVGGMRILKPSIHFGKTNNSQTYPNSNITRSAKFPYLAQKTGLLPKITELLAMQYARLKLVRIS